MIEIEAKYLIAKPDEIDEIERILEGKGFRHKQTIEEIDIYYNHPCRDFAETDEALRLRTRITGNNETTYYLTYKGPRTIVGAVKSREEYEVTISDIEVMKTILAELGFKEVGTVMKTRMIYVNDGGCEVLIDKLINTGDYYLEVECSNSVINNIYVALQDYLVPTRKTYLEIVLEKVRKQ